MVRKQIDNYYISRKSKLLKDFDKTVNIVKRIFVSRYGAEFANTILKQARQEFETLIPHLPYIGGNAPALRLFLVTSVYELALYKAMKKHSKTAEEAWGLCHEALKVRLETIPRFVRYLLKFLLFSNFIKKRTRKIAEKTQKHPLGDFAFRFVEGDGKNFDWGVDYTGCSIYKFICDQDAKEFAPYVCLSDIALSDTLGWGLIRTETLAEGFERCNFRFKKGGKTKVYSTVWKTK
ncbi:MAG: L-2-amino-thiazoline-4-carboxylic acid hydrolase [Sedimentisphaerales bacterium]